MRFVFSRDFPGDWHRRAVRIGLIEEAYGLSRDEVLTAARAETLGLCFTDYLFDKVLTHVAYSPDFVRPHNPANSGADFGPLMTELQPRRRQRQSPTPLVDEELVSKRKKKRRPADTPRRTCAAADKENSTVTPFQQTRDQQPENNEVDHQLRRELEETKRESARLRGSLKQSSDALSKARTDHAAEVAQLRDDHRVELDRLRDEMKDQMKDRVAAVERQH